MNHRNLGVLVLGTAENGVGDDAAFCEELILLIKKHYPTFEAGHDPESCVEQSCWYHIDKSGNFTQDALEEFAKRGIEVGHG